MANISKQKRDRMLVFLEELKKMHSDDASIRAFNEIENHLREKKYGLVWEEHTEEVDERLLEEIPVLCEDKERRLCKDENLPWNFIIEGDNLQALYLLEKTHRRKVDCIYIDPPYNTGAKDWKYNNDYVVDSDEYRHSKWLSMMKNRLQLAKNLLNPEESVLIVTIDEKEYLRLGCLLEELFPTANIQMVSTVINVKGSSRKGSFARAGEYLFFVMIGKAYPRSLPLGKEWLGNITTTSREKLRLANMMRFGDNGRRSRAPNCFYPIFITPDGKKIVSVGEPLAPNVDRSTIKAPEGTIAQWPIHLDGTEGCWGYSRTSLLELIKKGYLHIGKSYKYGYSIMFIQPGWQQRIENGQVKIIGHYEDGFVKTDSSDYVLEFVPNDNWAIPTHNATEHGMKLLQKFIGKRFPFPKSLYAVHDAINFFLCDKPYATVIDFFAGSGTTMHAVNLLNAEDGGNRKCIMVTNNEISAEEEKKFAKLGVNKGDTAWEEKGIAKYVTWPRTVCSITGVDVDGKAVKGNYFGTDRPMAIGFQANVKYFKCDWTPRKPEDYLLSNALCLHIKEMIELQTASEIDYKKNVLILNRDDFKRYILNEEVYKTIENIWLNQNMILSSEEMKLLNEKGFKYIPREYFGQELREAAE